MVSIYRVVAQECAVSQRCNVDYSLDKIEALIDLEPTDWFRWHQPQSVIPVVPRTWQACVFCARQFWGEQLEQKYIAGEHCFMAMPGKVAQLLSVERYLELWPLIPRDNIYASAVDLPHDGMYTPVLLHKRRITQAALNGVDKVNVCTLCYEAFKGVKPKMSAVCLANCNWIGRHETMLRDTTLGHELLLPVGRVVSTKVYLTSAGADEKAKQHCESWRQKSLQRGMQGTAIVFGNANVDVALSQFPPTTQELQDSFVAVFTGPSDPTPEERAVIQERSVNARAQKDDMARAVMSSEVQFQVNKELFDKQAKHLLKTNYVYKEHAGYREELVKQLSDEPRVPECFTACARFVDIDEDVSNIKRDQGPDAATTGAADEEEAGPDIGVEKSK